MKFFNSKQGVKDLLLPKIELAGPSYPSLGPKRGGPQSLLCENPLMKWREEYRIPLIFTPVRRVSLEIDKGGDIIL